MSRSTLHSSSKLLYLYTQLRVHTKQSLGAIYVLTELEYQCNYALPLAKVVRAQGHGPDSPLSKNTLDLPTAPESQKWPSEWLALSPPNWEILAGCCLTKRPRFHSTKASRTNGCVSTSQASKDSFVRPTACLQSHQAKWNDWQRCGVRQCFDLCGAIELGSFVDPDGLA